MQVTLISYTDNPEQVCVQAGKVCYSPHGIKQIQKHLSKEKDGAFLARIIRMGHLSVIEHASFSFMIEGISRACSHQLVRHRIASFSQKSQRYVDEKQFDYIIPPSIAAHQDAVKTYNQFMEQTMAFYNELVDHGIPKEDARFVLPNATETKIFVSMNGRELLHFFEKRLCQRAQWEIRAAAEQMLDLVKKIAPNMFSTAGPGCVYGSCPEGTLSCGKSNEMRKKYKSAVHKESDS
ncbi:MAG: FAD-dependent thymidylate synthase [Spirochaetales bacterium]|nr:FAD-dependent thymidylate synthase [Spirochaetales bacterium]